MNKIFWKRTGIAVSATVISAYSLFLLAPLALNPVINNYSGEISKIIKDSCGLNSSVEGIKFVTTPKLTAGIKVKNFKLLTPKDEEILNADDFQIKMSLLPLFVKRIRVDAVQLKSANANIKMDHKGHFDIEKYLPQQEETENTEVQTEPVVLPFGLKLSNHLPDIRVGNYNVILTDGVNKYIVSGDRAEVTDFILNKHVKIATNGKMTLRDREQFNYNIKIFNKIMPNLELNDLVCNPQPMEENKEETAPIDIIGILDGIYQYKFTANADADLTIAQDDIKGQVNVSNVSLINLPASNADLKFKGNNIDILSDIYTAKDEVSHINGVIKTGSKPKIDMNFKSGAEITNILNIVKNIALIFNIKDLQTLSANGKLDADFNIKSDMKSVNSSGYLKIPTANLYYGLYKIGVDSINADIRLDDNNINIKNIGFSILNQPLKFYGTISEDAVSDLHLTANKLNVKGLIVACGQAALLKDNNVNSGTVSMNVDIKGKLDKINPLVKINLENLNIKNVPANTTLKAPLTVINITSDGKTFSGNAKSTNLLAINPAAKVSIPNIAMNIREDELEITQTPVTIDKIKINVSGKIKNYLKDKMTLDFVTTGNIKSDLIGDINMAKQTLSLNYATTAPSTIIVPMFDKSKMTFSGNIGITGNMANPILKGQVSVPSLSIPEIPVSMTNMAIKLNGAILNGSATVEKFTSGGIEAETLTSDFSMKGENFYLNNLKGTAFNGKINGNIIYNLNNAKTTVEFKGTGLNAEKAVYGGTGIKNALTGTLGFDTKLTLTVADYNDMMNSMRGNLNFDIKNGAFGAIGRLENYLHADNIISNAILKSTVATISNAINIADTATFNSLSGKLTFVNGWAELNPVKSSGPLLSYYVKGKYNLLSGNAILVILGRLDGSVVAKMGPIGQLSATKLLSYIPKFGTSTANFVNSLTASPKNEPTNQIPALTNGSTTYKDFKVVHSGIAGKASSIKSFKWLTEVDTSAIETKTMKETINDIKTSVGTDVTNTIQSVTDAVTTSKEQWNTTKDQLKNSAEELKNLFKF